MSGRVLIAEGSEIRVTWFSVACASCVGCRSSIDPGMDPGGLRGSVSLQGAPTQPRDLPQGPAASSTSHGRRRAARAADAADLEAAAALRHDGDVSLRRSPALPPLSAPPSGAVLIPRRCPQEQVQPGGDGVRAAHRGHVRRRAALLPRGADGHLAAHRPLAGRRREDDDPGGRAVRRPRAPRIGTRSGAHPSRRCVPAGWGRWSSRRWSRRPRSTTRRSGRSSASSW